MTTKWYYEKGEKRKIALERTRVNRNKGVVKHSKSYQTLVKRSELLNKPSVVGISASGISNTPDVQKYLKENKLEMRAGIIRKV